MSVSVLFLYTPLTPFTCSKVCLQGWLMCFKNWCTLPRKKNYQGALKATTKTLKSCTLYLRMSSKHFQTAQTTLSIATAPYFKANSYFLLQGVLQAWYVGNEKVSSASSVDARTFAGCRYLEHHLLPEVLLQLVGLAAEFHVLLGPHTLNETDVTRFLLSDVT